MMSYRCLFLLLAVLVGPTCVGCKSFDLMKSDTETKDDESPWWNKEDLPPVDTPVKVVAIWASSVFNEPTSGPVRGLGGRVYFYNAKHKPVRVEGELTAFLYDDTSSIDQEQQEATKQVKFTAEEVAEKYTPTEFGPSYSFWLPWDAVGGERAQLSVIPVFKSKSGEMLVGEQARYVLPGKKPVNAVEESKPKRQGVMPASFIDEAEISEKIKLKSSTIRVPHSMQERLRRPRVRRTTTQTTTRQLPVTSNPLPANVPAASQVRSRKESHRDESQMVSSNASGATVADTYGRRPGVVRPGAPLSTLVPAQAAAAEPKGDSQPSADSQRDLLRAQTLRSAQRASARDRNLLDRAKSLFAR